MEEDLFKEARKKAIDERVAFANVVNRALRSYLENVKTNKRRVFTVKVYKMGKVKGGLGRRDLYEGT